MDSSGQLGQVSQYHGGNPMFDLSKDMIISLAIAVCVGLFVADATWNGFRGKK